MFFLRDLPTQQTMQSFSNRYREMDISATKACLKLMRVGSDVMSAFERLLQQHNLSQGRFLVLVLLFREPEKPLTPSELSDKMGVRGATLTGLLDKLEAEGLVVRKNDLKDRRKTSILITRKGELLLDEVMPQYYLWIQALMSRLSSEDMQQLSDLLEDVAKGLPAMDRAASNG